MNTIQLTIDNPCSENWDQMTPEVSGRYCDTCEKSVISLSTLSNAEIYDLFSNATGDICGRIQKYRLETPFYANNIINRPTLQLRSVILGAILLTSAPAFSNQFMPDQHNISLVQLVMDNSHIQVSEDSLKDHYIELTITDQISGQELYGVKVKMLDTSGVVIGGAYSDEDGIAALKTPVQSIDKIGSIEISVVTHETLTYNWADIRDTDTLKVTLMARPVDIYSVGGIGSHKATLKSKRSARQKKRRDKRN